MENIVGLKELRQNIDTYVKEVRKGKSFIVVRRSKPVFKISPPQEEEWETIIDFSKIRKGGLPAEAFLRILEKTKRSWRTDCQKLTRRKRHKAQKEST